MLDKVGQFEAAIQQLQSKVAELDRQVRILTWERHKLSGNPLKLVPNAPPRPDLRA